MGGGRGPSGPPESATDHECVLNTSVDDTYFVRPYDVAYAAESLSSRTPWFVA